MKLFSILTAVACALVVSACASTPAPTDERVHVVAEDAATEIQPGNIYISTSLGTTDENGALIEEVMRWAVKCQVKLIEIVMEHAGL